MDWRSSRGRKSESDVKEEEIQRLLFTALAVLTGTLHFIMLLLCILLNFCWSPRVKLSQSLDRVAAMATFICNRRDLERIIKKTQHNPTTVFPMKQLQHCVSGPVTPALSGITAPCRVGGEDLRSDSTAALWGWRCTRVQAWSCGGVRRPRLSSAEH